MQTGHRKPVKAAGILQKMALRKKTKLRGSNDIGAAVLTGVVILEEEKWEVRKMGYGKNEPSAEDGDKFVAPMRPTFDVSDSSRRRIGLMHKRHHPGS